MPYGQYDARRKVTLSRALKQMIKTLSAALTAMTTMLPEIETLLFEDDAEEDLQSLGIDREEALSRNRDDDTATIGHIQRRLREVEELKKQFEASESPTTETLETIRTFVQSGLMREAISLTCPCPVYSMHREGPMDLSIAHSPEVQERADALKIYCEALQFGFREGHMSWERAPFDGLVYGPN